MKANKSPDNTEVTPSKRKLKQARLPFMLISDVSPKAAAPQGRKRKLSVPDVEPVTKVGKICNENDLTDDLVVISDDESRDATKSQTDQKPANPYVKLVDTARKKKLQKNKTPKKAKQSTKSKPKGKKGSSNENITENNHEEENPDVEMMEVEAEIHTENTKKLNDSVNSSLPNGNESELSMNKSDLKTDPLSDHEDILPKELVKSPPKKTRPRKSTKTKKSSPRTNNTASKTTTTSKKTPQKTSAKPKSLQESSSTVKTKPEKAPPIEREVIYVDDSSNSADVNLEKPKITHSQSTSTEKSQESQNSVKMEQKTDNINVTPTRSTRKKVTAEEINTSIVSTASSKLDESITSAPATPKRNKSSANLDDSMNESTADLSNVSASNLTPKQVSNCFFLVYSLTKTCRS